MGDGSLRGLVLPAKRGVELLLRTLLRKITLLLALYLGGEPNIALPLCFLRVQIGRSAGLKATRGGLLCGHTSGIGNSTAGELLCGPSSKCV